MLRQILKKTKKQKTSKLEKTLTKAMKKEQRLSALSAPTSYDKAVFVWMAPQYIQAEKSGWWYVGFWSVTLLITAYGFMTGAWSLSLAMVTVAVIYQYFQKQKPEMVKVIISPIGIKFGNKKIPYSHIKAFWIHYNPPFKETLELRPSSRFEHDVIIPLEGHNPAIIREYLSGQIREWEGQKESVTDILIRTLKL